MKQNPSDGARPSEGFLYEDDYVGVWRHTRARLHTFYAAAALDVRRVRTFAARRGASVPQLTCYVPVFSLFKIYGSVHLRTPGKALRSNDPFVEQGDLFERAISRQGTPFGADDFEARMSAQEVILAALKHANSSKPGLVA